MSLIDSIRCEMPLPEGTPDYFVRNPYFQTYDLGRAMGDYVITKDRELQVENTIMSSILMEAVGMEPQPLSIPLKYKRKRIEMYASNLRGAGPRNGTYVHFTDNGDDYVEITFVVQIRNGKISSIKEKHRSVKPALDYKTM